ncbi:MerR family transcriptional regulator [Clostridium sp. 'White wine YQ']|uniref:MerR family transcriptional regulator n=1 Tax=Clostridium sp. 'White wine YQ' TaxID=3027474 RepID=UPI002365E3FD|nr:MerR family transcriptional regulator [Clostridium sp. 'White wine YQ']MDD7795259.1 MerR family transcriptional regulator [Clostridium sp. 'White wine YQ']
MKYSQGKRVEKLGSEVMKIGAFSKKNNITLDSIRHYITLGLLVPNRNGKQYDFDERCQLDIEEIINLKELGFSLNEIKTIFFFKKFASLARNEDREYYRGIFKQKCRDISIEIEKLSDIREKLEEKLKIMNLSENIQPRKIGVDIRVISLLNCSHCNEGLILTQGSITDNKIIEGTLSCKCGKKYIISEGILMDENTFVNKEYITQKNSIKDYILETSEEYLDNLYKTNEWLHRELDFNDSKNKVILELGTGWGYFLRSIYSELPESCTYIAVDRNINSHIFLKSILENLNYERNILFICCDFLDIPIKNKSVDIVMDISGTSNFSFENREFLLALIDNKVKEQSRLIGSYILFKNFVADSFVDKNFRINFILEEVKKNLNKLGYKLETERVSDYVEEGGPFENYFKKGEKVYTYNYYGKR